MPLPDNMILSVIAVQAAGSRKEMLHDREHAVFSAVIVRAQVLNNNLGRTYLHPDAFTARWAEAWNGVPVVVSAHPSKRGMAVSARDPEVLNSQGVGQLFRARVEDSEGVRSIKAEVWLEIARAEKVAELKTILASLEAGTPVELSTGFPVGIEESPGVLNGAEYDRILRPLGTDHLAIFGNGKKGACSVEHGCGLGVNHQQEELNVNKNEGEGPRTVSEGRIKRWTRALLTAAGAEWLLGNQYIEKSDDDRREALCNALREAFGGLGKDLWVVAVYSESSKVVFEIASQLEGWQCYQADYAMAEDGAITVSNPIEVERQVVYTPKAGAAQYEEVPKKEVKKEAVPQEESKVNTNQEESMERKDLIAKLVAKGPLAENELGKLSDCDLKALLGPIPAAEAPKPVANAEEPKKEVATVEAVTAAVNGAVAQLMGVLDPIRTAVEKHGAEITALRELTTPVVNEQERERTSIVEALIANQAEAGEELFTKEELTAKPLAELRKIAQLVGKKPAAAVANWSGRGGPKAGGTSKEPAFMPVVPYHETPKQKEA